MSGQVTVTSGLTPDEYVNDVLLGYGITATNVVYQGDAGQIGEVLNLGDFGMPIQGGLALGSGFVDFLAESTNGDDCGENFPNSATSTMTPQPLATDLLNIANSVSPLIGQPFSVFDVNDIAVIEFDFVATGDSVKFDYVFASVEYPDGFPGQPYNPTGAHVNSGYNDVFAFFLSGPGINGPYANNAINIAVVPESDPELPITISSVNGALNDEYFVENTDRDPICPDGYTVKLTCESEVECGATYHITIAIGDGNDSGLSSFVILESGSFESNAVVDIDLNIDVGADVVNDPPFWYEDCGQAVMVFTRPEVTNLDVQEEIEIVYSGTATYGVDYTPMPLNVVFPPGVVSQEFLIQADVDGIPEGVETVQMEILNLAACNGGGLTSYFEFGINDTAEPLQVDGFNTELCVGDSVTLEPVITGGYGNFIFDWSCNPGEDTVAYNFVPTAPGLFNCVLTVSDTCGMPSDAATFEVDVIEYPPIDVDLGPDLVLPCNGMQTVFSTVTGGNPGAGGYTYSWEDQDGFPLFSWTETSLDVGTWMGVTEVTLIVEDECGLTGSDTINVSVDVPAMGISIASNVVVLPDVPFTITAAVAGGQPPYNFAWTSGFTFLGFNQTLEWTTDEDVLILVEVTDACGQSVDAEVAVFAYGGVGSPLTLTLPEDLEASCGEQVTIVPQIGGGVQPFNYLWSDDDGNILGSGPVLEFNPSFPSVVTLQVTDAAGAASSDDMEISVPIFTVGLPPFVSVPCNSPATLIAEVSGATPPVAFSWSVEGVYAGNGNPLIVSESGVVSVDLMANDNCGQTVSASSQITFATGAIGLQDSSNFINGTLGLCLGDIVLFEVQTGTECGESEVTSWFWDFGDGTTLETTNTIVPHLFAVEGCYPVTLTPLDAMGEPTGVPDIMTVLVSPGIDWNDWGFEVPEAACLGMEVEVSANAPSLLEGPGASLPDNPGAPVTSELIIAGSGTITDACDLEVTANMYHTFIGDLTIWLECPNGQEVLLLDNGPSGSADPTGCMWPDLGGNNLGNPPVEAWDYTWTEDADYIIDDPENPAVAAGVSVPSGEYLPCGSFCDLAGCPVAGTWTLHVWDQWGGDSGELLAWGMSGINELTCYNEQLETSGQWTMGTTNVPDLDADFLLTVPGSQLVSFFATNGGGCSADTSFNIDVADPSDLGITAGPDLLVCNAPVVLQGGFNESGASNCSSSQGTQTVCYGDFANDIYTYCPDNPGDGTMMSIAFYDGQIENCFFDQINVFDGSDVTAPLVETLCGLYTGTNVMATNPDGCLTVQITSDGSVSCASGNYDPVSWCVGCGDGSNCDYLWDWEPSEFLENPNSATPSLSGWNGEEQTFVAEVEVLSLANCVVTDTILIAPSVPGFHLEGYSNTTCDPDSGGLWLTVQYDGPEPMPAFELSVNGITLQAVVGEEFHYATLSNDVFVATLTAGEEACLVGQQQFVLYFPVCVEVGCTDSLACNFNPEAELEDGTCLYADDPCEYCTQDGMVGVDSDGVCGGLDVQVVMDTVLYEGFADVPPGFRRYRIYAEIPDGYLMLGPAADDQSSTIIPSFGYDAPCGCYNQESEESPDGHNSGFSITAEALAADASLAYDSWWTTHMDQANAASNVIEIVNTFGTGFNICSDEVTQGGLLVTAADPVHAAVTDGQALVGQITTCESFSFNVCVAMYSGDEVTTLCTDGEVQVPDLCAPIHNATLSVNDDMAQVISAPLPASVRYRLLDWSGNVLTEQYGSGSFNGLNSGVYQAELLDTATTVAWSSNTCRSLLPFAIECDGEGPSGILGCTFSQALNFNPLATQDDGSCILPGCTDPAATNYNPYANQPDGSCVGGDSGCPGDLNFDGLVGVADLILFLQNFGDVCGEPETDCAPATMDGYTYSVVEIGDQCWFAENLRTTTYADGTVIPAGLTDGEWTSTTSGATAVFGEGSSTCQDYSPDIDACDEAQSLSEYGRLYNWYAVDDARGLCPSGWHVPTDGEWMVLEMELGMSESEANSIGWRGTDEGTQLKSTYGWYNGGNGTDDFGFSALPGGNRYDDDGYFASAGYYGLWWSSSPSGGYAWLRYLDYFYPDIYRNDYNPRFGFSVRCLRDAE